ncbi:hypothetical protein [Flavobacterium sp.]|uniref:hypothetical protein n=1 Tax=Flavobacterium sp. TaxID=239 RepID=UPI003A8D1ABA
MKNKTEKWDIITKILLFIVIITLIFAFFAPFIFTAPAKWKSFDFTTTGPIGDTIGGLMNPFIAISAAILTFLAFYIQKKANDELKKQFETQKEEQFDDFLFNNYKERISLIINEINNFHITFYNHTLVSSLDGIQNDPTKKKYNFIGIQAISLFLPEYAKIRERNKRKLNLDDTSHSILLYLNNLLVLFYNTHKQIINQNFNDDKNSYKDELESLLSFLYYSKVTYVIEQYKKHGLANIELKKMLEELYNYYKLS